MSDEKAMTLTLRQLRDELNALDDVQLDRAVRWWGEERGGTVKRVDVLGEDYVCPDDRDGYMGRSDYVEGDPDGVVPDADHDMPVLPAGTVLLVVD